MGLAFSPPNLPQTATGLPVGTVVAQLQPRGRIQMKDFCGMGLASARRIMGSGRKFKWSARLGQSLI